MSSSLPQRARAGLEAFRTQPRLRLGVYLVAVLLLVNAALALADARRALLPEIERTAAQHARLEQVLADTDWNERAAAAQTRLEAIESRLWQAESAALARAEFQSWLERQAGEGSVEMRVPVPVDELPGVYRVAAEVSLDADPPQALRILARLLDAEQRVLVDALALEPRRRRSAVMELHALYRIGAPEDEA